jgi:hypothetical protein
MSRKGNCWDNAVAESFLHTLKTALVYVEDFNTHEQAQTAVFERIFTWANFLHLIVNKSVKCDFLKEPSGYKPLIMEKSNT